VGRGHGLVVVTRALADSAQTIHSPRWQKEKTLDSSANARKYTQIFKSNKINYPQVVAPR
jgi:hypothetical protein